jgi:hypothetical protein
VKGLLVVVAAEDDGKEGENGILVVQVVEAAQFEMDILRGTKPELKVDLLFMVSLGFAVP